MGKQAVSFEGSVTTTGRSEAVRLEKAFFRAHPEFRQKARVRAQATTARNRPITGTHSAPKILTHERIT